MRTRSSVWEHPVAPLFAAPPAERARRALPVLRQMRPLVAAGAKLLDALLAVKCGLLEREFARHELVRCLLPGFELRVIHEYGDPNLVLWLINRAVERAGGRHAGGHRVSSGPLRLTARAA